jgi:hypothetical protein
MIFEAFSGSRLWILENTILVASYESMVLENPGQKHTTKTSPFQSKKVDRRGGGMEGKCGLR